MSHNAARREAALRAAIAAAAWNSLAVDAWAWASAALAQGRATFVRSEDACAHGNQGLVAKRALARLAKQPESRVAAATKRARHTGKTAEAERQRRADNGDVLGACAELMHINNGFGDCDAEVSLRTRARARN